MAEKDLRVNEQIRAREVRLIRDDGDQGIMSVSAALELAREADLDLVEVAPQAVPPVVKILNYGKLYKGSHNGSRSYYPDYCKKTK